jgi:hypothetical protein
MFPYCGKKTIQTRRKNMKELITPFLRPIALAVTLVMAGSGSLCAQSPQRAAASSLDRAYQQSLRTMQNEARRVGLTIDTDIDVLIEANSHMLLATIDGFENIVLEEGLNEFDVGFAGVAGIEGLPDGYYRLHYLVDLSQPEDAIALLINSRGEFFTRALTIAEDPHPERGARKGLTSEGGAPVATTTYHRDVNGNTWCFEVKLIAADPHPERGARKGLTSEGGAPVATASYHRDVNGNTWCMELQFDHQSSTTPSDTSRLAVLGLAARSSFSILCS